MLSPTYMKNFQFIETRTFLFYIIVGTNLSYGVDLGSVRPQQGNLDFSAQIDVPNGTNAGVSLTYIIKNNGGKAISLKYIRQPSPYEGFSPMHKDILNLQIWSSVGHEITSYYESPINAHNSGQLKIHGMISLSEVIINPGEEIVRRIDLSKFFPISHVGDYKCRFIRYAHVVETGDLSAIPNDQNEMHGAMKLEFPELRFNVSRIDTSFKSPLSRGGENNSAFSKNQNSGYVGVDNSRGVLISSAVGGSNERANQPSFGANAILVAVLAFFTVILLWFILLKRRS
jgi:hypothetical protein